VKLSELIHKSAEYPSLDFARVTVFFQDIVDDGSASAPRPAGGAPAQPRSSILGVMQRSQQRMVFFVTDAASSSGTGATIAFPPL
jgi:hypothetical protein